MSCNYNDINLEDDSLFQYVLELDETEKKINSVGPKNPDTFGNMVEPFKGKRYSKKSNYIMWLCVIAFIVVAVMLLMGPCRTASDDYNVMPNYRPAPLEYRPMMRATFVRN